MKNPKFSYMIRALCGVYLLWIVWDFITTLLDGEELSPVILAAMIVFAIFGVAFVITGVRGWIRVNKEQQEEEEGQRQTFEAQEAKQKTPAGEGMSLSDRANLVKNLEKTEEESLPADSKEEHKERNENIG